MVGNTTDYSCFLWFKSLFNPKQLANEKVATVISKVATSVRKLESIGIVMNENAGQFFQLAYIRVDKDTNSLRGDSFVFEHIVTVFSKHKTKIDLIT